MKIKTKRLFLMATVLCLLAACSAEPTTAPPAPTPEPVATESAAATATPEPAPSLNYQIGKLHTATLDIDGITREYTIFVPPLTGEAMPLVVGLHGLGGNGIELDFRSGWSTVARTQSFVVVYPQALSDTESSSAWFLLTGAEREQDIAFIRQLVAEIQAALPIDSSRIYAAGESLGGGMANRLACDAADLFAAVAVVSGVLFEYDNCFPSRPTSVIAVHGALDDSALYIGVPERGLPFIRGWAEGLSVINNCVGVETAEPVPTIRRIEWLPCDDSTGVALYTLMEGGHGWPNSDLTQQAGDPVFNATTAIWEFFATHPR